MRVFEHEAVFDPRSGGGEGVGEKRIRSCFVVRLEEGKSAVLLPGLKYGLDVGMEQAIPCVLRLVSHLDEVVRDRPLAHTNFRQLGFAVETRGFERGMQRVAEGAVGHSLRGVADESFQERFTRVQSALADVFASPAVGADVVEGEFAGEAQADERLGVEVGGDEGEEFVGVFEKYG